MALGARNKRKYAWYVRETQDQADRSVENIADLLEAEHMALSYPDMSKPERGKFGNVRGWRRQRLRAANGFTVDAIGLDTARRGAKVREQRPDLMVFDDIDGKHDTENTTKKKIETITTSLLPAGANNLAVIAIQNLIIADGVFSQMADGRADFLANRIVSGPHPALIDMEYEQRDGKFYITAGEPTWAGQDRDICQQQIDDWGLTAFLQEAQHNVEVQLGGMFDHLEFVRCDFAEVPDLVRTAVWVDPAVTATDKSDSMGIQVDGIDAQGTIYRLYSWEQVTTPLDAIERAIKKAIEHGSLTVGVETDQGGDTWDSVYWRAVKNLGLRNAPYFVSDKAGSGHGSKVERASRMLTDYEHGRIIHVRGTHQIMEKALRRFPATKPFDLVDACYWSWDDLRNKAAFSFKQMGGATPDMVNRWKVQ